MLAFVLSACNQRGPSTVVCEDAYLTMMNTSATQFQRVPAARRYYVFITQ